MRLRQMAWDSELWRRERQKCMSYNTAMYAFSIRFPRFGATFIETQNGSDITP